MNISLPAKTSSLKPVRRRFGLTGYGFIAPFFGLLLIFGIAPLAFSLIVSFFDYNPTAGINHMKFSGLWAYNFTFTDPYFWNALGRTLRQAVFSAIPQHLIAIPLAFVLHMAFKRIQGVLGTVFFLPYMTSSIAAASVLSTFFLFVWQFIDSGMAALSHLPLIGGVIPSSSLYFEDARVAFVSLWGTVGWNVLLYLMVLNSIPRSLYEAAQLDGAGFWGLFRRVALPLMQPMIFVAFTMSFLRGFQGTTNAWYSQSFDPRSTDLPTYIFRTGFWDFDMGLASEMTMVYFLGMVAVVLFVYLLIGRNFSSLDTSSHLESDQSAIRFSASSKVVLRFLVLFGLALSVIPVVMVLFNATRGYPSTEIDFRLGDAFGSNIQFLLQEVPSFWSNFKNSLYICSLAALGAMVTASLAAYGFAFLEFRGRNLLYAITLGVMLFPSLLSLIPTVLVIGVIGWIDQARAIWVPATVSAFGVFLIRQYLLGSVPKSLLEAGRVDGASELRIFATLVMPLARPVLVTLGLLTFVTVWNNSGAALAILKSTEKQMVTQVMSNLSTSSSAFTVGIAIASLPAFILFLLSVGQVAKGMNISSGDGFALLNPIRNWLEKISAPSSVASGLMGADGIRAMACLMVVFHHLSQRLNRPEQSKLIQEAQAFIMTGAVGVSAFFVLSGMLLSIPFWRAFLEGRAFPNMLEFTRRRAVRIVPGFYASLTISVILTIFFVHDAQAVLTRYLAGLSFLSALNYVTLFPADLNGPLWSIGFEVLCYAMMPIAMWFMFSIFASRADTSAAGTEPQRASFRTGLIFWLGVLALTLIAHQLIITDLAPDNVNRGWDHGLIGGAKYWMPNYNAVGMFGHYILGVIAAGVIVKLRNLQTRSSWLFDGIAFGAFTTMAVFLWTQRYAPDFAFSLGNQPYFYPLFPLLIAIQLCALPFSRILGGLFGNPFFKYTAKISFGLYIWHYLILELIRLTFNPGFAYFGISSLGEHLLISGLALVLAFGAASASYKYIEAPFLTKPRTP
jgi:ABC-type glycerol-3-phosphate transport system permease component/peptidoglycan/LPS O-acetylase OafA/YrhL